MTNTQCPWCWWVGPDPCADMAAAAMCRREPNEIAPAHQGRCGVVRGDGSIRSDECALPRGHQGPHYGAR